MSKARELPGWGCPFGLPSLPHTRPTEEECLYGVFLTSAFFPLADAPGECILFEEEAFETVDVFEAFEAVETLDIVDVVETSVAYPSSALALDRVLDLDLLSLSVFFLFLSASALACMAASAFSATVCSPLETEICGKVTLSIL